MFNFRPTGLPGFRVGLPEDDEPGFNVPNDGSTPPVLTGVPDVPAFDDNYPFGATSFSFMAPQASGPNPVAPLDAPGTTALPAVFASAGTFNNADSGLLPTTYGAYVPFAGGPSPQDPVQASTERTANFYTGVGGAPLSFADSQGLSTNPTALVGGGSLSPPAAGLATLDATASENLIPAPHVDGGGLTPARYDASDPPNRPDPSVIPPDASQNTSSDDDFQLARSAQAQAPQPQTPTDTSPGEVVVLPDGSTIPDPKSSTGKVMAPTPDLSAVAAAGRRTGFMHRAMLINPLSAGAAPAWMVANLRANVSHGGTFDYQRRGGQFLHQFTPVSNVNVGLFAQQAGMSLKETLATAGLYARLFSSNAKDSEPYGLDPDQPKYITAGFRIGESGAFGGPAAP
jgi:hypothetical protein